MLTREEKREREKNKNFFFDFVKIQNHFFRDFVQQLKRVNDNRHQSYITYGTEVILYTILLKNVFGIKSMRRMTEQLNKDECIENIRNVLCLEELHELPHFDTINDFLSKLDPRELEKINIYMIKKLFDKRCFESYRIQNKYWPIIVDGTGIHTFKEKHCEHCLRREYKDKETGETKVIYMHHVLEAKLVFGNMVFSIGTEFIENESENVSKQDCELKAFQRLAAKIKNTFKRLPICLLGDSLYACESVFELCDKNNWKYIFRFKEGRIGSIASEFRAIKSLEENQKSEGLFWVNDISYNQRTVNLLEKEEETKDKKRRQFLFITNIRVTKKNAERLMQAGRSRWKIENEGFNNQKNGWYQIEHVNCQNYTAMKNHYLLVQITDILVQLYLNGSKLLTELKKSAKEISSKLLEAFRTRKITVEDIKKFMKPIQIRFT
jgi:hypothetical protein